MSGSRATQRSHQTRVYEVSSRKEYKESRTVTGEPLTTMTLRVNMATREQSMCTGSRSWKANLGAKVAGPRRTVLGCTRALPTWRLGLPPLFWCKVELRVYSYSCHGWGRFHLQTDRAWGADPLNLGVPESLCRRNKMTTRKPKRN